MKRATAAADKALATKPLTNPWRIVVGAFLSVVAVGTVLLALPFMHSGKTQVEFIDAFFTSVSAVTVTGLLTVDTATSWSAAGHVVILALIQVGGFGILSAGTLILLVVSRRLGLSSRLLAQGESNSLSIGEVRGVLKRIFWYSIAIEVVVWLVLSLLFSQRYDYDTREALWFGAFHSISAFNNAGFALFPDSFMGFASDGWFLLTIMVAIFLGSIGFPVIFELVRAFRSDNPKLSIHTRLTLHGSFILIFVAFLGILFAELNNPATMGPMSTGTKLLNALFTSVSGRTAGFNTIDFTQVSDESSLLVSIMMLIGGGSASTAGGIKVTTIAVLFLAFLAQVRRDAETTAYDRTITSDTVLESGAIALSMVGLFLVGTFGLLFATDQSLTQVVFEAASATGTTGMSMGITSGLGNTGQIMLTLLMLIGRLGPLTLGAALAFRASKRRYRLPESRPFVG